MLGKLLKYEIPAMGRKLLPLYAAWAVTALVLGISTQSAASKTEFMAFMSVFLYTVVAVAILVMTVILIIQRYNRSLLGDEAYFSQVLPVSVTAHIGNKLISATIWVALTMVVALLTGLLVLIGMGFVTGFESFKLSYIDVPGSFWLLAFEVLILMLASIVKSVMQIYAAITIGHQAQNHTTLASIGAYIAVLIFEASVGRILMAVLIRFVPSMDSMFNGNAGMYGPDGMLNLTPLFFPALLIALVFSAIYFFVCKYLMENRLNLA